MSHTKKKLYVGTQNDMLYLIDQPPSPAPIDYPHEGYGAKAVAKIYGGDYQEESENARRLVACWNALLPFTTEQIEDGIDLVKLVQERDELLEALRLAHVAMEHMGDVLNSMDAVEDEDLVITTPAFEAVHTLIAKYKEAE